MAGCVQSIIAGADLVIPLEGQEGAVLDALLAAIADGRLPEAQVDDSVRRMLRLGRRLPAAPEQPEHRRAFAFGVTRTSCTCPRRGTAQRDLLAAPPGIVPLAAGNAPIVVECMLGSASEAEQVPDAALPLLAAVRVQFPGARGAALPAEAPTEAQIATAHALAVGADTLVIGTSDLARFPRQAEVVASLMRAARRVVVIAQRGPYDLGVLPSLPHAALIATYGDSPDALAAAVALIAGDAPPLGRLPVSISDAFPRGSGLTEV